jgi:uncharacterized membrane protein YagU involved in acid resistance
MKPGTRAVLIGGGIAATCDIVYACAISATAGISPTQVLQSVASGWLGNAAFEGGQATAALGFVSHYGILFVAAALYLLASRRFPMLRDRAVLCGLLFGVGIYVFMNFVVVPLSAVPFEFKYTPAKLVRDLLVHTFLVGLPIALAVRRHSRAEAQP